MRGKQKKHKPTQTEVVTIDGLELRWTLQSEPHFTTEFGYKGLCISVRMAEGVRRELILEYPFPGEKSANGLAHQPLRAKIVPAVIEADIRRAIAAGWRPNSRGKPFTYRVPA
jgi:hypothetical protein